MTTTPAPDADQERARRCAHDYYVRTAARSERLIDPRRPVLPRRYGSPSPPVVALSSRIEALDWMDQEYATILGLITAPDTHPEVVAQLADSLWSYAQDRVLPREEIRRAHACGLRAARTLDDPALLGRLLTNSARAEGDDWPARALEWLDEAHDLYLRQQDAASAARTLYYRGRALRGLGHDDAARLTWLRAAIDLLEEGETRTAALAHTALAQLANREQRYLEAAAHAATAEELLRLEADEPDLVHLLQARVELGCAEAGMGHAARACEVLDDAAVQLERVGATSHAARALMHAGGVHEQYQRRTQAVVSYYQAQALASQAPDAAHLLDDLHRRIKRIEAPEAGPS